MERIFYQIIALALIMTFTFIGCKKEEFTEDDALQQQLSVENHNDSLQLIRDSLNHYGGIINYNISVVSGGDAGFNKSTNAGLDSVTVTVSQYGKIVTKNTANGLAVFPDLRIGTATVTVSAESFTNVHMIVDLTPGTMPAPDTNMYNILRQASTMIPIFSLDEESASTINGIATYEKNLLNSTPEIAANVEVIGVIDIDDPSFKTNFLETEPADYAGKIVQIAYSSIVSKAKTDSSGHYSLKVPSTADGLPIKVLVSEMAIDQTLLLNSKWGVDVFGEQTVRTIFSSDMSSARVSNLPRVAAAYVTFAAPTGSANLQATTDAVANAIISESGIENIVITNPGSGYTQAPLAAVTGGNGQGAQVTPVITGGMISGFTIDNAGSGYTANPTVTLLHQGDAGAGNKAQAEIVVGYSIIDYIMGSNGSGYTSTPSVSVSSSNGSGATAQAVMSGYVSDLTLTSGGSGYVSTPTVVFSGNSSSNPATATANMTTENPISEITVLSNNTWVFLPGSTPVLTISGNGSGATATYTLANKGWVFQINPGTFNGGAGYDPLFPPAVTISGDGFGATADATVNAGGDITINILTYGHDYSSATVSIDAPPTGGTQATADAVVYVPVESVTVINQGNGYTPGTIVALDGNDITPDLHISYSKSVNTITLTNGGGDFSSAPSISFVTTDGLGSGAAATAEIMYNVKDIIVTTEGSGYEFNPAPIVTISAPSIGGGQAIASAVKGNGIITEVHLLDGGSGYTAVPNVILANGGFASAALISATVSGGAVTALTIDNAGFGYTSNPSINISTYLNSASATATAYTTAGQIVNVNITNPGEGYVVAPNVEFEVVNGNGSGTGATATATIDASGRVSSITITNAGSGYYTAPLIRFVIPTHNLVAHGDAIISNDGFISGVNIVSGGAGYITVPSVTFTASVNGMGVGASGIAQITDGKISSVVMTNQGSGYLGQNAYIPFGYNSTDEDGIPFSLRSSEVVGPNNNFKSEAGKTYIIDVNLGTGLRTVNN